MKIDCSYTQLVPVNDLKPSPRNPNKHSDDQINRLMELIQYYGIKHPIIVSKRSGLIVAGHGRLEAIKRLGFKEAPVDYQDFESEEQEYGFLVADNAIADWADLSLAEINVEIPSLGPDFNVDMLGIKDFVIEPVEKYDEETEDEVPEAPKEPKSKIGDLYEIGTHRLLCGDSTDILHVEKLMDGQNADITFTSPPYNLGNNAKLRGYNGDGKDTVYTEKSDHKNDDDYLIFLTAFTSCSQLVSRIQFINIQLLAGNKLVVPQFWFNFRNKLIDMMIWDKEHAAPQMAARVLNSVFEIIFIFSSEDNPTRAIHSGSDFRGTESNIYRLNPVGKKDPLAKNHGAVFPVQFCEYFVSKFSDKSVYDPFGGSGSTLIACQKTNRKCFMMEIDPHYIDVIVSRWVKYTGINKIKLNGQDIEWEK